MVIRTIDKTYSVIRTLPCGTKMRAYLCAAEDDSGGGQQKMRECGKTGYLVMAPKNGESSEKLLLFLMELSKNQRVDCLLDCFTRDGAVWGVFRYYEGIPLTKLLNKGMLPEERFDLARELIEQIFAGNLPVYLQYEASKFSNIVVSGRSGLRVNFLMTEPERLDSNLFPDVLKQIAAVFELIYEQELKGALSEEPGAFVEKLKRAEFSEGIDVYRAYRRMDGSLRDALAEGKLTEKGYLTRIWNFFSGKLNVISRILYGLLIAGLTGILIYVCVAPETAPAERNLFQSIGTLEIMEYGPVPSDGTKSGDTEAHTEEELQEETPGEEETQELSTEEMG